MTPALDVACGPRSFYFDKADERVTFCDLHPRHMTLCGGKALVTFEGFEDYVTAESDGMAELRAAWNRRADHD